MRMNNFQYLQFRLSSLFLSISNTRIRSTATVFSPASCLWYKIQTIGKAKKDIVGVILPMIQLLLLLFMTIALQRMTVSANLLFPIHHLRNEVHVSQVNRPHFHSRFRSSNNITSTSRDGKLNSKMLKSESERELLRTYAPTRSVAPTVDYSSLQNLMPSIMSPSLILTATEWLTIQHTPTSAPTAVPSFIQKVSYLKASPSIEPSSPTKTLRPSCIPNTMEHSNIQLTPSFASEVRPTCAVDTNKSGNLTIESHPDNSTPKPTTLYPTHISFPAKWIDTKTVAPSSLLTSPSPAHDSTSTNLGQSPMNSQFSSNPDDVDDGGMTFHGSATFNGIFVQTPSPVPSFHFSPQSLFAPSDIVLVSFSPISSRSNVPSREPSVLPSIQPTNGPSLDLSMVPSTAPSFKLSESPSLKLSEAPSFKLSEAPSIDPSQKPSGGPSLIPSRGPSHIPSRGPSSKPSNIPQFATFSPTLRPTADTAAAPFSPSTTTVTGTSSPTIITPPAPAMESSNGIIQPPNQRPTALGNNDVSLNDDPVVDASQFTIFYTISPIVIQNNSSVQSTSADAATETWSLELTPLQIDEGAYVTCRHVEHYIQNIFALSIPYVIVAGIECSRVTATLFNPISITYTVSVMFSSLSEFLPNRDDVNREINMALRMPHSLLLIEKMQSLQKLRQGTMEMVNANPLSRTIDVTYAVTQPRPVLDAGLPHQQLAKQKLQAEFSSSEFSPSLSTTTSVEMESAVDITQSKVTSVLSLCLGVAFGLWIGSVVRSRLWTSSSESHYGYSKLQLQRQHNVSEGDVSVWFLEKDLWKNFRSCSQPKQQQQEYEPLMMKNHETPTTTSLRFGRPPNSRSSSSSSRSSDTSSTYNSHKLDMQQPSSIYSLGNEFPVGKHSESIDLEQGNEHDALSSMLEKRQPINKINSATLLSPCSTSMHPFHEYSVLDPLFRRPDNDFNNRKTFVEESGVNSNLMDPSLYSDNSLRNYDNVTSDNYNGYDRLSCPLSQHDQCEPNEKRIAQRPPRPMSNRLQPK